MLDDDEPVLLPCGCMVTYTDPLIIDMCTPDCPMALDMLGDDDRVELRWGEV